MMASAQRLLVIDDEPEVMAFIRRVAEGVGYAVRTASTAGEFAKALAEFSPDAVVLDLAMPETDGIELLDVLTAHKMPVKVLIISGFDPTIIEVARSLGHAKGLRMAGAITKPVRAGDLKKLLVDLAATA